MVSTRQSYSSAIACTSNVAGKRSSLTKHSSSAQYNRALMKAQARPGTWSKALIVDRALPDDVTPEQISLSVNIMLERAKDRANPYRTELAGRVRASIENELLGTCTANPETANYHLKVIVALASDGSADGRLWASELGYGHIKLSAIYILSTLDKSTVYKAGRTGRTDSMLLGFGDVPIEMKLETHKHWN